MKAIDLYNTLQQHDFYITNAFDAKLLIDTTYEKYLKAINEGPKEFYDKIVIILAESGLLNDFKPLLKKVIKAEKNHKKQSKLGFKLIELNDQMPAQVKKQKIHPNGLLYSEGQIKAIVEQLNASGKNKFKKSKKFPYSVIKSAANGRIDYYAEYGGKENILGKGTSGKVRLIQKIASFSIEGTIIFCPEEIGKWHVEKIFNPEPENALLTTTSINDEQENLKQVGIESCIVNLSKFSKPKMLLLSALANGVPLNAAKAKIAALSLEQQVGIGVKLLEADKSYYDKGLLRRDIKPDNVIYKHNGEIALIDLGVNDRNQTSNTVAGSLRFIAPETHYSYDTISGNEKTEIYNIGMTLANFFEMDDREVLPKYLQPFAPKSRLKSKYDYTGIENQFFTQQLHELLKPILAEMTDNDPSNRPTFEKAIAQFKEAQDACTKLRPCFKKVALISIDDLVDKKGRTIQKSIDPLKLFDEVYIIDEKKRSKRDRSINILGLLNGLGSQGIAVSKVVVPNKLTQDGHLIDKVILKSKQDNGLLGAANGRIENYFYLSANNKRLESCNSKLVAPILINGKKQQAYLKDIINKGNIPISKTTYDFIIGSLSGEEVRLQGYLRDNPEKNKKILGARIKKISETADYFKEIFASYPKNLTSSHVQTELEDLERKMIHTNGFSSIFFKSTGHRNILALREEALKMDIEGHQSSSPMKRFKNN